jgi:hypothetical protein
MLNRKKKLALEEMGSLLAGWSTGVPGRARRFHALRADLDQQARTALDRWWLPGPGEAELARLRQQVERLGEIAAALSTLIRRTEEAEKEVLDLRGRAERETDRELSGWLTDRCVDWQSTLRRLGVQVEREPELEKDQATLGRTEDLVRAHANAVRRLDEARQLLDRVRDPMKTAALRADLPLLRERLLVEGAGPAWLADIERVVGAVRAVGDLPPRKPPQTLGQAQDLLFECRSWQRVLQTGGDRNDLLRDRYLVVEKDWEDRPEGEIQSLFREAGEALADLRRTAAERRAAALTRLAKRSLHLADACGPSPELEQLEQEVERLRSSEPGDPDSFEEWMEQQDAADRHLLAIARIDVSRLQARIDKLRSDFAARLKILRAEPLSSRAAGALERLSLALAGLPDSGQDDLEPVFQSLETCDRITLGLDVLSRQIDEERGALQAIHQRLLARHQALREEVARCGIEVADVGPRIVVLSAAEPGRSLDDLRLDAEALELELAAREKELAARCEAWIAESLETLRSQVAVLQVAGRAAGNLPEPPGEGSPPSQWAETVVTIRALAETVHQQIESVQGDLETRADEFRDRLDHLPLGSLRPEVRRDATDRSLWLSERSWRQAPKPEERVRKLLDGLTRCELLLAKLSQEDREAQDHAEALRTKLRDFNERDLDRYCPDALVHRVSALIAGIPAEPERWGELADQLDLAENLLELLETHATRIVAARVEQAIPGLERQAATTRDPAFACRIRALLAQLAACDEHEAVPAGLSAQILLLAPERAWEGGA